jgi:hypothetical protein
MKTTASSETACVPPRCLSRKQRVGNHTTAVSTPSPYSHTPSPHAPPNTDPAVEPPSRSATIKPIKKKHVGTAAAYPQTRPAPPVPASTHLRRTCYGQTGRATGHADQAKPHTQPGPSGHPKPDHHHTKPTTDSTATMGPPSPTRTTHRALLGAQTQQTPQSRPAPCTGHHPRHGGGIHPQPVPQALQNAPRTATPTEKIQSPTLLGWSPVQPLLPSHTYPLYLQIWTGGAYLRAVATSTLNSPTTGSNSAEEKPIGGMGRGVSDKRASH